MTPEQIAAFRQHVNTHDRTGIGHFTISCVEAGQLLDALDAANAELSRLRSSPAPVVGGVPDLTIDHEMVWAINYYKEGDFDSTVFRAGWYALASRLPALKPGEVEELAILREIVRMLDEARERNRRRPRGAGAPPMGDEIDDLLHRLCEIGAHPAMRAQPTPTEKEPT
jgi:hypothetical protein